VSYDIGLDLLAEPGSDSVAFYFERSVAAANRLVDVFPDSAVAHALMAATLGNLAQFQGGRERIALAREVERHSRRAIELDSTLAYPYVALGVLYREISTLNWVERTWARLIYGSIPEASIRDGLDGLKQAARLDPLMPFVHHELASTYLALGDTAQARVHWRRLLVLRPRTTQDLRNRDNARRNLGGRAVVVTAGRE
jgi:tetratricopeptide (TPR) repeat protein